MSYLRYYDESVMTYFNDIIVKVNEDYTTPQITFAVPSRKGVKLELTDNKTPVLPLIAVIRIGMTPNAETRIVKNNIQRPFLYSLSPTKDIYEGAELMPYTLNYQIDYFSLIQNTHNELSEKILFKLHKKHHIKTYIDVSNHNLEVNGYIYNVSVNDSTAFTELPDSSSRIFHGVVSFSLDTMLIDPNYATKTVLDIQKRASIQNNKGDTEVVIDNIEDIEIPEIPDPVD